MTKKKAKKTSGLRIILCAGEHGRAVITGTVDGPPVPGQAVEVRDARMILYWSAECGGLLGLAARGPQSTTRITHAVPRTTVTRWTESIDLTAAAAAAIDGWPSA